jgi:hypothetical protein
VRGGIQKKGNRWYAVVYDGIDPATGKKRRRWVAAGTRRSDAERVLADLIRRKYDGEPVPTERLTVAEYLTQRWLPIQKSRVRSSTYDAYRRNVDLHVVPALGRRQLDKLTAEDIDLFYATLLTERSVPVPVGRERRRELFGFGAVCSGGMPATSFAPGEWVEPFVDDGVVLVALAYDVGLHDRGLLPAGSVRGR